MPNIIPLFPCPEPAPDDFARFWAVYPKQQKIGSAKRRWAWALLQTDAETIIAAAAAYAAYCKRLGTEEQFIATPDNWLTDERWNDVYGTAGPTPVSEEDRVRSIHKQWYCGPDNAFKRDWRANRISEADKAAMKRLGLI